MTPEVNKDYLLTIRGLGIRIGSYELKMLGDGGYFHWAEDDLEDDYVEDDMTQVAWRDLPAEYRWED